MFEPAGTWRLEEPPVFFADKGPLARLLHLVDDQLALVRELRGGSVLTEQRTKISGPDLVGLVGCWPDVTFRTTLFTHGLRLIDQISAENAVMSAAIERIAV